ncbi:hypothetical protein [Mycolicibacterium smegmatis]|uniref:hypothetical protein n=1 Tax=Mycolicibacterium smegmatis TaxID=1772 RepID=UPI0018E57DF6|nr:hypothetical protein [Mycolicibacterium smegmatis]
MRSIVQQSQHGQGHAVAHQPARFGQVEAQLCAEVFDPARDAERGVSAVSA